MQKKNMYRAVTLVVLVLGYLNYYRDEKPLAESASNVIETSDVIYETGEYQIEAGTQFDDLDTVGTSFSKARALFSDMDLSGDNVFIDNVKNMILENNIFGKSKNGWSFNTEKARYSSEDEKIYSSDGVIASNIEKNIEISGKNFETDSTMSYVILEDNIVIKNENFNLTAERAYYTDETKIVDILDNIKVTSKELTEETDDSGLGLKGNMSGEFEKAKYNTETGILEAFEPFVMHYNDMDLYGEKLWYDENTGNLLVSENVKAVQDGFVLYMDKIEFIDADNEVTFHGKLHGGDDYYDIEAENGYYNTETKILDLKGDVIVTTTDGDKLMTDVATYNTVTSDLVAIGTDKDVVLITQDGRSESKKVEYNNETQVLKIDQKYTFVNEEYTSVGDKLYYDSLSGKGTVTNGSLKSDGYHAKGDIVEFDTIKQYHEIIGNAYLEQDGYELKGDLLIYNEAENLVTIPNEYVIVNTPNNEKYTGQDLKYNTLTGEMESPGEFVIVSPDYKITGLDILYNNLTGYGSIESDVKLVKSDDGTVITGERGHFKRDEFAKVIGNMVMKNENYVAYADEADYRLKEEEIHIPGLIIMEGNSSTNGTMYDGVFDVATNTFTGNNFEGRDHLENVDVKGDEIKYYVNKEVLELVGNVDIQNPETRLIGEHAEYHTQNSDVYADDPFTIYYDNMVIDSTRGKFNLITKDLDGENVVIVTEKGERLEGNQIYGSFIEKNIDITGDVKANLYNINEETGKKENVTYEGDFARVYFVDDNGLKATRSEIRENGVFVYQDMILYSDYVEIDFENNLALGRQGSKVIMSNGTQVISEIADMNLTTEVINLINDVELTSTDPTNGYKKATADRIIVKNKENIAELEGSVRAETDSATIDSDRGIYDMNTDKFRAIGNVFINYEM